jgi:hypothetical protein
MKISLIKFVIEEVINIECVMSLINIKYLTLTLFKATILQMSVFINVRDINNALHQSSFYVMIDLYLKYLINDSRVRDHIKRKFHLVDELKCKLLMILNVIISKEMTINLTNKFIIVSTCENLIISIRVTSKLNVRIRRVVHSKKFVTISSSSIVNAFTYLREKKLSFNKDFLFKSNHNALIESLEKTKKLYTHVCDCNLAFVHVRNELFKSMIISSRTRLRILIEYEKEECFQIDSNMHK